MDKEQLTSYISDIFDAVEKLSETTGALTSYVMNNNNAKDIDDAYFDTLDEIKDGVFDTPEEAVEAIIELF